MRCFVHLLLGFLITRLSIDLSLLPEMVLDLIVGRWSIKVTYQDSKQILGGSYLLNL